MTDFESSRGSAAQHTYPAGVGVLAIAATGLLGLSLTALTPVADVPQSLAITLTTAGVSDVQDLYPAQDYLTGTGFFSGMLPDGQRAASEYLSFLRGDAQLATSQLDHESTPFGTFVTTISNDLYDLFHLTPLTNGSPGEAGTVLPGADPWSDATNLANLSDNGAVLTPPSGVTLTPPTDDFTHSAGVAPASGDTASQLMSDVDNEQTIVTNNMTAVDNEWMQLDVAHGSATTHGLPVIAGVNELGPISDAGIFETEINAALTVLGPIPPADEHNPFLISDLSRLLNDGNSMNDALVDFYTSVLNGNTAELTADNAALVQDAHTTFDAAQGVVIYFDLESLLH